MALFLLGAGVGMGAAYLCSYVFGSKLQKVGDEYAQKEDKAILLPENTPQITKEQICDRARKKLDLDGVNKINIGFCGQTKAGKSRLVNTMRKVKKGDPKFAPEGESECTLTITPYPLATDAKSPQSCIVLWDIPGAGTLKISSETYFTDNFLYIFDVLLLMIGESIRQEDIDFAKLATEHGVPWAFIRSKCDRDLRQNAEDAEIAVDDHILTKKFDSISFAKAWNNQRTQDLEKFKAVKKSFIESTHNTLRDDLKKFAADLSNARLFCISSNTIQHPEVYKEFQLNEIELDDFIANEVGRRRHVPVPSE